MGSTVPLTELPVAAVERLEALGAPATAAKVPLYRAIANQPDVIMGWIELSWRLRLAVTPRRLRELMIIRTVMLSNCESERKAHVEQALANGVDPAELEDLAGWRVSPTFSEEERAALALSEAMYIGKLSDDLLNELTELFEESELIELIVTCGFYNMVPRVVDVLRLPTDT